MTDVSVVILNYNGKHLLEKFLGDVILHSPKARIIVADNGSTDSSISLLESAYPSVEIIRIPRNLGFCGGYNVAMRQVTTSYAVLLNSDVQVSPQWLEPVISILQTHPEVAAAQPKMLSYQQKDRFEYAGAAGGYIDSLGYPLCRGRIFDHTEIDQHQYDDDREVFWATGACLFIRTGLFNEMNGFDEDFFAHMEEIDLCWKLQRRGLKVVYCAQSVVYHVGGATLAAGSPRKVYYNFRNGLFLIIKHMSTAELIWKLPLRILLDWVAALVFLAGHPAASIAVIKAHFSVIGMIRTTFAKRKLLRSQLKTYLVGDVFHGSVVWQYFVMQRKTYRELMGQ
jgi:GT2 family glycosyltransferase